MHICPWSEMSTWVSTWSEGGVQSFFPCGKLTFLAPFMNNLSFPSWHSCPVSKFQIHGCLFLDSILSLWSMPRMDIHIQMHMWFSWSGNMLNGLRAILHHIVRTVNSKLFIVRLKFLFSPKDKCYQYWPTEGSVTHGEITIEIKSDTLSEAISIRDFLVTFNQVLLPQCFKLS